MRAMAVAMLLAAAPLVACGQGTSSPQASASTRATIPLTIVSSGKRHAFSVEVARTAQEQQRGLMFRTTIAADGGMLFAPYPAGGGTPQVASFWMKNTPSSLDIIFIRADRTIASIAAETIPLSEAPVSSGEPVAAVLELRGGRAAELGIGEGDRVEW